MRPPAPPSTARRAAKAGARGRDLQRRYAGVGFLILQGGITTAVVGGVQEGFLPIPEELDGAFLVDAQAFVYTESSSGDFTMSVIKNGASYMLSTDITIDEGDGNSIGSIAPRVIDLAERQVAAGDRITFDVVGEGTGMAGLVCQVVFG